MRIKDTWNFSLAVTGPYDTLTDIDDVARAQRKQYFIDT